MKFCNRILLFLLLTISAAISGEPLPAARDVLPAGAWNYGIPDITDRAYWNARKDSPVCRNKIKRADKLDASTFQAPGDDLYLQFVRNGNRSNYERAYFALFAPVNYLTVAACATDAPRYIVMLERLMDTFCSMRTWVLPAHDRELANFHGTRIDIDLRSSLLGSIAAQVLYLTGPRLSPEVREKIRREVMRRVVTPFADMVDGKRPKNSWFHVTSNWNAVCLSEVGSTLLAMDLDPELRWRLLDATVRYLPNYLAGIQDGYCSEGINYWNYGFGRFIRYAVTLSMASGGRLNLLDLDGAREAAMFPERIRITKQLYPAFADSNIRTQASSWVIAWRDWQLGQDTPMRRNLEKWNNPTNMMDILMQMAVRPAAATAPAAEPPLLPSSLFRRAGVACVRPGTFRRCRLSAAFKGGSNNELHNHNDVGSYILVLDEATPIAVDPGTERYTARTFSSRRYESDLISSRGHSVPEINGIGQSAGKGTDSRLLEFRDSETAATASFDLRRAYPRLKAVLKKLERRFDYSRQEDGSFSVTDTAAFREPVRFETAVITCADVEQLDPRTLLLHDPKGSVRLSIECGNTVPEIELRPLTSAPADGTRPRRIAIRLPGKVLEAKVILTFRPENRKEK